MGQNSAASTVALRHHPPEVQRSPLRCRLASIRLFVKSTVSTSPLQERKSNTKATTSPTGPAGTITSSWETYLPCAGDYTQVNSIVQYTKITSEGREGNGQQTSKNSLCVLRGPPGGARSSCQLATSLPSTSHAAEPFLCAKAVAFRG